MGNKIDNILTRLGTNNSSQIATAVLAGFKMIFLPIATATDKTASPEQKKYTIVRDIIMEGLALFTYIGVTGQIQKHSTAPICSRYYKDKANKIEKGIIIPAVEISKEEIEFLKNVDSKKIKEAGNDFLTRISTEHKVMSDETRNYINKLDNLVMKINGEKNQVSNLSFDEYINKIYKDRKPRDYSLLIFQDFKRASKDSQTLLKPMKAFQNTRIALSQLSVWTLALIVIPPMCNVLISPIMKSLNKDNKNKPETSTQIIEPNISMRGKNRKCIYPKSYGLPYANTGMRV